MFDNVEIREFNQDDKEKVDKFFNNLGSESRAFFNRNGGNHNKALKFFDGDDNNAVRYMAVADDTMIGYVFLYDIDKTIPWLGICIADELKGKNFGRILINKMIDYCKENNKGGILLTTHISNLRGQGLYERCGFERLGIDNRGEILYLLRFKGEFIYE